MTTVLYQEWLRDWDSKLRAQKRNILLLQDNFSAHNPPADLTNIEVINFAPNLTAHVQPADAGIICCFKAHYRTRFASRAIDHYDANISPANIYDINILEAMRLAAIAWKDVDTTTIRNCWRKAAILPESLLHLTAPTTTPTVPVSSLLNTEPQDLVMTAEEIVSDTLAELERRGVLQTENQVNLEELLNPVNEANLYDDGTDDEIYSAVME